MGPAARQVRCPTCFHPFPTIRPVGARIACPMCEGLFQLRRQYLVQPSGAGKAAEAEAGTEKTAAEIASEVDPKKLEAEASPEREETGAGPRKTKTKAEAKSKAGSEKAETKATSETRPETTAAETAKAGLEEAEAGTALEEAVDAPASPAAPAGESPVAALLARARRQGRQAAAAFGELRTAYRYSTLLEILRHPRTSAQWAGLLLVAVFLLSLLSGAAYNLRWSDYREPWEAEGYTTLQGTVHTSDGTAVEGVNVSVGNEATLTNAQGKYFLYNLTGGDALVTFKGDGYFTESIWVTLRAGITVVVDAELEEGDGELVSDRRDDTRQPWPPMQGLAVIFVAAGAVALAGGAAALLHRHFRLALLGAVVGVLSYGFFLGSALSLLALVLLLRGRHCFTGDPLLEEELGLA